MAELQAGLYRGEIAFCKTIKKIEKSLQKHRISYDYSNGVFTVYAEVHNSDYYKELVIYTEEDLIILNNSDYTKEYYVTEYADFEEIPSYLFTQYNSTHSRGLLLTRN